jgi:hypothetical protein
MYFVKSRVASTLLWLPPKHRGIRLLTQDVCCFEHPRVLDFSGSESSLAQETQQTLQAATASLLGRFAAQPLHGPRVMLLLNKLLPPGLAAAVRDGPGALPSWLLQLCVSLSPDNI